jgi:hypothetical protein
MTRLTLLCGATLVLSCTLAASAMAQQDDSDKGRCALRDTAGNCEAWNPYPEITVRHRHRNRHHGWHDSWSYDRGYNRWGHRDGGFWPTHIPVRFVGAAPFAPHVYCHDRWGWNG